ncbi:hypothetical protein NQ318_015959 [Aromia moschata]|uniref:Phospholipase A2-like domain-containing protein n=1 Tax=Aromia moschata TaxID=1265417 RepID=A0AAV8X4M6_9CUCU|nr:hypothetical protein NQ318_015959 [Aromia moschata]
MALNALINKLPIEIHAPGGYRFCGPGTKLEKRLARGDRGINELDEACREHDIQYSKVKEVEGRYVAYRELARKGIKRVFVKDASIGEKATALGVAGIMSAKVKLGMGLKKKKKSCRGGAITFRKLRSKIYRAVRRSSSIDDALKKATRAAECVKKQSESIKFPSARIIPIPKSGGVLPLLPIFAGLSALGALAEGAGGILKAINDSRAATS